MLKIIFEAYFWSRNIFLDFAILTMECAGTQAHKHSELCFSPKCDSFPSVQFNQIFNELKLSLGIS